MIPVVSHFDSMDASSGEIIPVFIGTLSEISLQTGSDYEFQRASQTELGKLAFSIPPVFIFSQLTAAQSARI